MGKPHFIAPKTVQLLNGPLDGLEVDFHGGTHILIAIPYRTYLAFTGNDPLPMGPDYAKYAYNLIPLGHSVTIRTATYQQSHHG